MVEGSVIAAIRSRLYQTGVISTSTQGETHRSVAVGQLRSGYDRRAGRNRRYGCCHERRCLDV